MAKKKKTPLYKQYGFQSEAEFRKRYPQAGTKRAKGGRVKYVKPEKE